MADNEKDLKISSKSEEDLNISSKSGWKSARKIPTTDARNEKFVNVSKVFENPIMTGYFLTFCRVQHAWENILFIMECDRFKDIMGADMKAWRGQYTDLDKLIFARAKSSEFVEDDVMDERTRRRIEKPEWPSKVVHRRFVDRRMKEIWDNYLSLSAPTEICIPAHIREKTFIRMNLVHMYGPTIFDEALLDPFVTLRNDLMPRFLTSPLCREMNSRLAFCASLPDADSLLVDGPLLMDSPFVRSTPEDFPPTRLFELNEMISDPFLYAQFLAHLRSHYCPENLLCVRKILEYEELYTRWVFVDHSLRMKSLQLQSQLQAAIAKPGAGKQTRQVTRQHSLSFRSRNNTNKVPLLTHVDKDVATSPRVAMQRSDAVLLKTIPEDVDACAWTIYRYFVAREAAYEIPLSVRQRKDIMIALARPDPRMFDALKATAMGLLTTNFNSYKFTHEYTTLAGAFRQNFVARRSRGSAQGGCVGGTQSDCLPVCLPACVPVSRSECLPSRTDCLPVCLPVRLPACLPACLPLRGPAGRSDSAPIKPGALTARQSESRSIVQSDCLIL
jgi:hypothetical protein